MRVVDVNVVFRPLQEIRSVSSNKRSDRSILERGEDIVASYKESSGQSSLNGEWVCYISELCSIGFICTLCNENREVKLEAEFVLVGILDCV